MKLVKWNLTLGTMPELPPWDEYHADALILLGRIDVEELTIALVRYRLLTIKESLQWSFGVRRWYDEERSDHISAA